MNSTKRSGLTRTERDYEDQIRTVACPVCSSTSDRPCTEWSDVAEKRYPIRISHTGRMRAFRGGHG